MKKIVFLCAINISLQPFCLNAGKDNGIYQQLLRDIKQDLKNERVNDNGSAITRYAWKGVSFVSYALVAKIVADPFGVYNAVLNTMNYALGKDTNKRVQKIQKTVNRVKENQEVHIEISKKNNTKISKVDKTTEETNSIVKDNNKLNNDLKNAFKKFHELEKKTNEEIKKQEKINKETHNQTTRNLTNIAASIIGAINNSEKKLTNFFDEKINQTRNDIKELNNYNKNRFDEAHKHRNENKREIINAINQKNQQPIHVNNFEIKPNHPNYAQIMALINHTQEN